jgi:hypothetical protein
MFTPLPNDDDLVRMIRLSWLGEDATEDEIKEAHRLRCEYLKVYESHRSKTRKAYNRAYQHTPKRKTYRKSEKRKTWEKAYNKEYRKHYKVKDIEVQRKRKREWARLKYYSSPENRAYQRNWTKKNRKLKAKHNFLEAMDF